MANIDSPAELTQTWRAVVAGTLCLLLSEWFRLPSGFLSVLAAHMTFSLFPHTAFQRQAEIIVGVAAGVFLQCALVAAFQQNPPVLLTLTAALLLAVFYVLATGRFTDAALFGAIGMADVALGAVLQPVTALTVGRDTAVQFVLGAGVAFVVTVLSGGEKRFALVFVGLPLWPPRPDLLARAARITLCVVGTAAVAVCLDLPPQTTAISAVVLAVSPDRQSLEKKGLERTLGDLAGAAYATGCVVLLHLLPELVLMVVLVALGLFLSNVALRAYPAYQYTFLQMGLVVAMVVIGPEGGVGTPLTAAQRLVGIGTALGIAEVVYRGWPPPGTTPSVRQMPR